MKKKQQKISTIEDLATLIQGEFLVIQNNFAEVRAEMHAGFAEIHTELDGIHVELDGIHTEIAGIHTELDELRERITRLEVTVNRIDMRTQNQVDAVYTDVTLLKKDVEKIKDYSVNHVEWNKMEKRMVKLEKLVFAKLSR